ncbi:portal protein [Rhodococcus phage Finch]|uniref:Portal protein n=1 Tax=Rhodococcus phage Finch TaxID=2094144 RepID=A0A2P1JXB3_9CAUD|nr:portal protein [Rhodococcus phage Finch]AVO24963.1 portal protein [Rhodococcus phage Finch]
MGDFTIVDKRGSSGSRFTKSAGKTKAPLTAKGLRSKGFALPSSNVAASKIASEVEASLENRKLISAMRKTAGGGNIQMALPKVREPMSSFKDKGIPFDTTKPQELKTIRHWARMFYSTHDLIPLLIDIYSKFPLVGLEFTSKDPQIKDFYESMFMDGLDYDTFLQDLGREYFISGEVNSLAHFDESLGVWSAEEILNPDSISVSKSMFQGRERVQLLVKDLVDTLRGGSTMSVNADEKTKSEQLEKAWEYQQLQEHYPEIIRAAETEDGLDISDALISRIVNKVSPWDLRGTPHLLRSFRTLLMEESLNAAQDAVADRLYSPFILATLGIANLGDNEPWIPDQEDLDEARDTMQAALAADFRLMVHNFGLDIKSVFGREAVPRFDTDYNRIDKKLMQAWGIGEALISGGSSSTYASSALNREFVTQMMSTFQKAVKKHIRKRCEVIAEAQGHYDYELKGGQRKPIYREIVEFDMETGEEYTRKVPKLLIPDVEMSTLNLRDEAQERGFLQQLRNAGVPISDMRLAVNIPIEFEDELEKQSEEKVQKLVAEAQAMDKAIKLITSMGLPIPPELAKYAAASAQLKKVQEEADTAGTESETAEIKNDVLEETGIMPGEGMGALPPGAPGAVPGMPGDPNAAPGAPGEQPGGPMALPGGQQVGPSGIPGDADGDGMPNEADNPFGGGNNSSGFGGDGDGESSEDNPFGVDLDNGIDDDQLNNSDADAIDKDKAPINIPTMGLGEDGDGSAMPMPPRNRTRPEESDEQRKTSPKKASFGSAPSSYGAAKRATERSIEAAMDRMAAPAITLRALVETDSFFQLLNRHAYMEQIRNDFDTIESTIRVTASGDAILFEADSETRQSFDVLAEMIDQYDEIYGFRPEW